MMDHDFTEWSPRQELASTLQCRLLLRGRLAPTPYWPSPREILNFGPTEQHANDVGLNTASRRVCSVFELLAFRTAHPAHDTNAALGRPIRVVCCHASHGSTSATSRPEPIRRVSANHKWESCRPEYLRPLTKADPGGHCRACNTGRVRRTRYVDQRRRPSSPGPCLPTTGEAETKSSRRLATVTQDCAHGATPCASQNSRRRIARDRDGNCI